jgi:hypothetical protein
MSAHHFRLHLAADSYAYPGWRQDILATLMHRMAFQKESNSHHARVEMTSPLLRRRAAVSQAPATSSTFPKPMGSPYARTHGDLAISKDDRPISALDAVVFEQISPGSAAPGAPSALLVKSFHGWAACTFGNPSLSSHVSPDVFVAALLEQNWQLAAALRMQENECEAQSCQEFAAGAASTFEFRRTQSDPGAISAAAEHEVELRRLRAQLAEAAAEKRLLLDRSWKLDICNAQVSSADLSLVSLPRFEGSAVPGLRGFMVPSFQGSVVSLSSGSSRARLPGSTFSGFDVWITNPFGDGAQHKLMAARPCPGCGKRGGEAGSLSAMQLYDLTGISIDAGGNLVL